jgi:hypothetical protein
MNLCRRQLLQFGAAALAATAGSSVAWAQAYPTRPVRVIIGWPAGGVADIVARLMAQWLSERLGQPFVVENRTGAATNLATEAVIRAPADGYTLLWATGANATNATFYQKLNFNFISDIAPKPLISAKTGRSFENFTRVETFGAPDSHWVRVIVNPADPQLFTFKPEIVSENIVNRRPK